MNRYDLRCGCKIDSHTGRLIDICLECVKQWTERHQEAVREQQAAAAEFLRTVST